MRDAYFHHAQLGETDAKVALSKMQVIQQSAEWELHAMDITDCGPVKVSKRELNFFKRQLQLT